MANEKNSAPRRALYEANTEGKTPTKPEKILNDKEEVTENNIENKMGVFDDEVNQTDTDEKDNFDDNAEMTGVVLLSGGLDSVAALAWAKNNNIKCHALIVDYGGSNNKREIKAAKKIARYYKVPFQVVKIDLPMWNRGLVVKEGKLDIYCDTINSKDEEGVAGEYVPARNTLFLAYAYAYAESLDFDSIIVGFNKGAMGEEFNGFGYMPDTSPVYCRAFQYVINTSTSREKYTIAIVAPFLRLTKADIAEYCLDNNVPIEDSYSCFKGEEDACGVCRACVSRLQAFDEIDSEDPAPYQNKTAYREILERNKNVS